MFFLFVFFLGCTPVKRYVGEVIEVSSWSGDATLKTKTETGKDTFVIVHAKKREYFVVGQIITCWSGGNMFNDCSTDPQ